MKRLHLICNAHIDPIWQWTWDEGISAAISTFKSAADLCDEFDYIFCHGESLLYEAIEKHAPELFERIKAHVKSGKWVITGGWYLQPDCLLPAGETFIRHIAVGQSYFREKFGVTPTVATNFDSFGHSIGLVQILAKNGYSGYMACRPNAAQFNLPSKFFVWRGPDGSQVNFARSSSYNAQLGKVTSKIHGEVYGGASTMLGSTDAKSTRIEDVDYILWGVGNHGGGPSRKDLRDIEELKLEGIEIMHSTPEALFNDGIKLDNTVEVSLVTCMPGCYSSMARVKQAYRRAENLLYSTEKLLAAASLCGMKVDTAALKDAEKSILLATFHDVLPGTSIEDGEGEALTIIKSAEKTLRDYRSQALLYLSLCEKPAGEGEYPVFVFNYQPYAVRTVCEVELMPAHQNWSDTIHYHPEVYDKNGSLLQSQLIKENSTLSLDWRKKVVFDAELEPLSVNRFTIKMVDGPVITRSARRTDLDTVVSETKLISSPIGLELYEDTADPWGMSWEELTSLGKNPTDFRLMTEKEVDSFIAAEGSNPVGTIEDGEIYKASEAFYTNSKTNAVVQYKQYKNHPYTDIKLTVEFAEKNKLLRVKIPLPKEMIGAQTIGDGPYVWENKRDNGEVTFQKWYGAIKDGRVFAVINDGVYGGKTDGEYLYLTLLRGTGYCFHPIPNRPLYPTDRYLPRIENGRYTYELRLFTGDVYEVTKEAEEFAARPYAVNVFPIGSGKKCAQNITVAGDIICSVIRNGDSADYVLRLYNPKEVSERFTVSIGNQSVTDVAKARSIVSVCFKDGSFAVCNDKTPV